MEIQKRTFQMISDADQLVIDCLEIAPVDNPKGIVQLVHGMCEYKERYEEFMNYMAREGFICVIHDHRGHGKSVKSAEGLGYFYEGGSEALVEDMHQLTKVIKENVGEELPFILLGHSMGSLAVRDYIKKYDDEIDGLVVIGSPSKRFGMAPGHYATGIFEKAVGGDKHSKMLDFLVMNLSYEGKFKKEGRNAWICSDMDVVKKYNEDPLCNYTFTVQGYRSLIELTMDCYSKKGWKVKNSELPILFLSGREDPCAVSPRDFGKSVHFLKDRGYTNVKAKLYHGMRHEILNEKKRQKVYQEIRRFIGENIGRD